MPVTTDSACILIMDTADGIVVSGRSCAQVSEVTAPVSRDIKLDKLKDGDLAD